MTMSAVRHWPWPSRSAIRPPWSNCATYSPMPRLMLARRQAALTALVAAKDAKLLPVLQKLIGDPAMRGAAIKALAGYDDPATPGLLLRVYASLNPAERRDVLNTLAARPGYAKALMDAVAAKKSHRPTSRPTSSGSFATCAIRN